MKFVFPEIENPLIRDAIAKCSEITAVPAHDLSDACFQIKSGLADCMIAGIDYSSRDVILACRDGLGMTSNTFSSSIVFSKNGVNQYVLADIATCKHPTEDQLYDIILQTYTTASKVIGVLPRVAILSFSTLGSGGKDDTMTITQNVVRKIRSTHPEIIIDGEMQLDAAIDPIVASKKCPDSPIAGSANVLICPDINSGNILYKAMERFGGFTAAGPILQGFNFPVSDLSRGSSVDDIVATIKTMELL